MKNKEKIESILKLHSSPLGGLDSRPGIGFSYQNQVQTTKQIPIQNHIRNRNRYLKTGPDPLWFQSGTVPFATLATYPSRLCTNAILAEGVKRFHTFLGMRFFM